VKIIVRQNLKDSEIQQQKQTKSIKNINQKKKQMKTFAFILIIAALCALSNTQMAGGYKEHDPSEALNNPEVIRIINYALATMSTDGSTYGFNFNEFKTVKVLYYATQVVAGLNYKLKVELQNIKTNESKFAAFTVWRKLGKSNSNLELSYSILGSNQGTRSSF
jgi:p-aminobenzoyl-glutamate transporter AbgT